MINEGLYSSKTDKYNTPTAIIKDLKTVFNWKMDVCASDNNVCDFYYDEYADGLKNLWFGLCWMNPPYGRNIGKWMKKAAIVGSDKKNTVVCLIPARTDTKWFQETINSATHITFIKGRLKFGNSKNSAPFPSAFVVFGNLTKVQASKLDSYGWTPYSLFL